MLKPLNDHYFSRDTANRLPGAGEWRADWPDGEMRCPVAINTPPSFEYCRYGFWVVDNGLWTIGNNGLCAHSWCVRLSREQ